METSPLVNAATAEIVDSSEAASAGAAVIKSDFLGTSEIGGEGKTALQTAIQGRQPTIELVV